MSGPWKVMRWRITNKVCLHQSLLSVYVCVSARICEVESLLSCLSSEVFIRESVWCIFASVCVCNGLYGAQLIVCSHKCLPEVWECVYLCVCVCVCVSAGVCVVVDSWLCNIPNVYHRVCVSVSVCVCNLINLHHTMTVIRTNIVCFVVLQVST